MLHFHPGLQEGRLCFRMSENPSNENSVQVRRDYAVVPNAFPVEGEAMPTTLCAYCGAPLDPFFYFCKRCATPYKTAQSMVGASAPAPLTDAQRVKSMAPHTWTVFWTYAWVLMIVGVIGLFLRPEPWVMYSIDTFALFVTTAVFAAIHWRPLKAQFGTLGFNKWQAWAGLGILVPLLVGNYALTMLFESLFRGGHSGPSMDLPFPAAVLIFCVFPAIMEEVAFRGLLQYWLEISLAPLPAWLLGSAMFAGLHMQPFTFLYLMSVGMLLAWVRRTTGSLYPGMLIHFLHNLVVIALFAT